MAASARKDHRRSNQNRPRIRSALPVGAKEDEPIVVVESPTLTSSCVSFCIEYGLSPMEANNSSNLNGASLGTRGFRVICSSGFSPFQIQAPGTCSEEILWIMIQNRNSDTGCSFVS
jgi:hypothetical protein